MSFFGIRPALLCNSFLLPSVLIPFEPILHAQCIIPRPSSLLFHGLTFTREIALTNDPFVPLCAPLFSPPFSIFFFPFFFHRRRTLEGRGSSGISR